VALIKGIQLSEQQKRQVLAAFIYRWTVDNHQREAAWNHSVPDKTQWPRIPLITDYEWLTRYSFYFTPAGSLSAKKKYAEPILPPPPPPILGSTRASEYNRRCLLEV
jgi:hypothetical protein